MSSSMSCKGFILTTSSCAESVTCAMAEIDSRNNLHSPHTRANHNIGLRQSSEVPDQSDCMRLPHVDSASGLSRRVWGCRRRGRQRPHEGGSLALDGAHGKLSTHR